MEQPESSTGSRANSTNDQLADKCIEYRRVLLATREYLQERTSIGDYYAWDILRMITIALFADPQQGGEFNK